MFDSDLLHTHEAVRGYVEHICFKTGPPGVVGAELEWLVVSPENPSAPVSIEYLRNVLDHAGPFPGGSTVTFEPGGQIELSSPPIPGLSACWRSVDADIEHLDQALAAAGLATLSTAIDPFRFPQRQVTHPRYAAMEAYFDRRGLCGRVMMCSTAAIQVNLDAGFDAADVARRWTILHTVGPALVAAFANSPVHAGWATGWKSTRQAVWQRLDPPRTGAPSGRDPTSAWARYALDAPIMLLRTGEAQWTPDPGFTFGSWVAGSDHDGGPPTRADLNYHLSTLFPPVRPRGWLEVRYIDTLPAQWWPVPVAVLTALVDVPEAGEAAVVASESVADAWLDAARYGLDRPALADAAQRCFTVAVQALPELGTDPMLVDLVNAYLDRYVARRRSPADDVRTSVPQAMQQEFA